MQESFQSLICAFDTSGDYPNITFTAGMVDGSPRIAGRLLSVREIVNAVEKHHSLQETGTEYRLTISQLKQTLQYCAGRQCLQDQPFEFCHLCSLKRKQKGPLNTSGLEEVTFDKTTYVRGNDFLFLGTLTELLEDWNGRDWWLTAAELLIDHRKDLFEPEE